jgi:hypothetical protein
VRGLRPEHVRVAAGGRRGGARDLGLQRLRRGELRPPAACGVVQRRELGRALLLLGGRLLLLLLLLLLPLPLLLLPLLLPLRVAAVRGGLRAAVGEPALAGARVDDGHRPAGAPGSRARPGRRRPECGGFGGGGSRMKEGA